MFNNLKNKKGERKMKKQKIPFYEKFDPVELWMWRNKKQKHSKVLFQEQIDQQARKQLFESFCSNASARPAFRQLGRAMGAGCSRRTRGHLRTASGRERLRPRPSVAERWALLIRKARGLQILTARIVFRRSGRNV